MTPERDWFQPMSRPLAKVVPFPDRSADRRRELGEQAVTRALREQRRAGRWRTARQWALGALGVVLGLVVAALVVAAIVLAWAHAKATGNS